MIPIFDKFLFEFHNFLSQTIIKLSHKNKLQEALLYATMNGGKRTRPLLCFIFARMMNNNNISMNDVLSVASAIECIHCYSLVHDDLPSMDNDDLRRGLPTTHKQYNEATAILVGDALQTIAFDILSHDMLDCSSDIKIKLIQILSNASGAKGMVNGQFLDMELDSEFDKNNLSCITTMHKQKTGALITASCVMGSIMGGLNDSDTIKKISLIGNLIGKLFQIQDDILDITQTTDILGKTAGKDLNHNKPTMTALLGLDNAIIYADDITEQLYNAIGNFSIKSDMLNLFVDNMVKRHY